MKYKRIMEQYAVKGCNMSLEEALHYITEMYMEQCGVSASPRTVIYESGERLFNILLEDATWKEKNRSRRLFLHGNEILSCPIYRIV